MVRPRQVSDEQVLEAALAIFMEHGPKAPVSKIADRLGVSDAAIFKRFGTKEDLLLAAVMPPEEPPFLALLEAGPRPSDVHEQLVEIAASITRVLDGMIPRLTLLQAAGVGHRRAFQRYDVPPPVRALRALASWIAAAQSDGRIADHVSPDTTAMMIMGSVQFRTFLFGVVGAAMSPDCVEHLPDAADYGREVIDSLWAGIAPTGEAS